jgi:hypothetical protein
MLYLMEKIPVFQNLESDILKLRQQAESIGKQLGAWIQSLLNSGMKGQRYVTDKVRAGDQKKIERDEFLKKLEQIHSGSESGGDEA